MGDCPHQKDPCGKGKCVKRQATSHGRERSVSERSKQEETRKQIGDGRYNDEWPTTDGSKCGKDQRTNGSCQKHCESPRCDATDAWANACRSGRPFFPRFENYGFHITRVQSPNIGVEPQGVGG